MKARLRFSYEFGRRLVLVSFLLASGAIAAEDACVRLMGAKVPGATIILAQMNAAGTFAGPPVPPFDSRDLTAPYKNVPAFCRVVAVAGS